MTRRILLLLLNLFILACIALVCVAPILSTAAAGFIAESAGCQLDEGSIHPCIVNGQDIGDTLYTMGFMAWFTFFSVPAAAVLLVIYILVILIIWLVAYLRKRRQQASPG